jgi:uncharacterized protein (TIGR02391 family)
VTSNELPTRQVLDLSLDQLAFQILQFLVDRPAFASRAYITSIWTWQGVDVGPSWDLVGPKVERAWELLLKLGLVELEQTNPTSPNVTGMALLTQRGIDAARHDADLSRVRAATRIEMGLHPILNDVRAHFVRRDYEAAVLFAMRAVEIRVRDLSQLDDDDVGTKLMRKAFNVDSGPLTDSAQAGGERAATADLFAGGMGVFKNPSSHREVDFDDPTVVAEIVLFADLLLRMLDVTQTRLEAYRRFMRDEVGDGSEEIRWPPGFTGPSSGER